MKPRRFTSAAYSAVVFLLHASHCVWAQDRFTSKDLHDFIQNAQTQRGKTPLDVRCGSELLKVYEDFGGVREKPRSSRPISVLAPPPTEKQKYFEGVMQRQTAIEEMKTLSETSDLRSATGKSELLNSYNLVLTCPPQSVLVKSAEAFFKTHDLDSKELKHAPTLQAVQALKSVSSALAGSLASNIRRQMEIYWGGRDEEWKIDRDAIVPVLDRMYARLKGKPIGSMAEVLQAAQTDEEKRLMDLLFSAGGSGGLDFLIGPDLANFYRNRLLFGAIARKSDGHNLRLTDKNSVLELAEKDRELLTKLAQGLDKIGQGALGVPTGKLIDDAWRTISILNPGQRETAKQYMEAVLRKIQNGITDQGTDEKTQLAAERLRSGIHTLLYGLSRDSQIAQIRSGKEDQRARSGLAELIGAPLGSGLRYSPRGAVQSNPNLELTDREKEIFPHLSALEAVSGNQDQRLALFRRLSLPGHGSIQREELEKLAEKVKNHHSENWASAYRAPKDSPFLYGHTLQRANEDKVQNREVLSGIAQGQANRGTSLSAEQRLALSKHLDEATLAIFAPMFEPDVRDLTDPNILETDKIHKALSFSRQELDQLLKDPKNKADEIFSRAALSGLAGGTFVGAFQRLAKILPADTLPGVDIASIPSLSAERRRALIDQIEAKLRDREKEKLSKLQVDGLLMASLWLRGWEYNPGDQYEFAQPNLVQSEISRTGQLALHNRMADLHKTARELGHDGDVALATVEKVKKQLTDQKLNLPLRSEAGLLRYLMQNVNTGPEVLQRFQSSLKPKEFQKWIAGLGESKQVSPDGPPLEIADQVHEKLKEISPEAHYLFSNARFSLEQTRTHAVKEILTSGRLSTRTHDMILALSGTYADCAPLTAPLAENERDQAADRRKRLEECIEDGLWREAALIKLRDGKESEAQKMLADRFPKDEIKRQTAWTNVLNERTRIEAITGETSTPRSMTRAQLEALWEKMVAPAPAEALSVPEARMKEMEQAWAAEEAAHTQKLAARQVREQAHVADLDRQVKKEKESATALSTKKKTSAEAGFFTNQIPWFTENVWKTENENELQRVQAAANSAQGQRNLYTNEPRTNAQQLLNIRREDQRYDALVSHFNEKADALERAAKEAEGDPNQADWVTGQRQYALQLRAQAQQTEALKKKFGSDRQLQNSQFWISSILNSLPQSDQDDVDSVAGQLYRIRERLSNQGVLTDDEGNPLSEEQLLALAKQAVPKFFAVGEKAPPVSEDLKALHDKCVADRNCGLTLAEMDQLKDLAERSVKGEIELDRRSEVNLYAEADVDYQDNHGRARAVQRWLVSKAKAEQSRAAIDEREKFQADVANRSVREMIAAKRGSGDANADWDATVRRLAEDQNVKEWGESIARVLPRRSSNFPKSDDPAFFDKAKRWAEQEGLSNMVEDWVWANSSGLHSSKVPEDSLRRYFYDVLLRDAAKKFGAEDGERQRIEARLKDIVTPSGSGWRGDFLWDWDNAHLDLVAPQGKPATGRYKITREEFDQLLDRYAETRNFNPVEAGDTYRTSSAGHDELSEFVHAQQLNQGEGRDTLALNPHTLMEVKEENGKRIEVFTDYASKKKRLEAMAQDLLRKLGNNGDIRRRIDHESGFSEGAWRAGRAFGSGTWFTGYNRDEIPTDNDLTLASELDQITKEIAVLNGLGSAKLDVVLDYGGKPTPTAAADVARVLSTHLGDMLRERQTGLEGVDTGYALTEEGIKFAAEVAAGRGAYAALFKFRTGAQLLSKFSAGRRGIEAVRSMRRAEKIARESWAGARILKTAGSVYSMAKLGALSPLYGLPVNAIAGTVAMKDSLEQADNLELRSTTNKDWVPDTNKDGVADWREAIEKGLPYSFPEDVRGTIDRNGNGIPDAYETAYGGRFQHEYFIGSVADLYNNSKWGAIRMSMAPFGGALVKPLLRPIGMGAMAPMIGMNSFNFAMDVNGINQSGTKKNWREALVDSSLQAAIAGPIDDIWAAKYLIKHKGSEAALKGATWRRALVNHGTDALSGVVEVWRKGHYETASGQTITNPLMAALASVGEGYKMAAKLSDPANAADVVPELLGRQLRQGKIKAGDQILNEILPTPEGNKTIREIIRSDARYPEYLKAQDTDALIALVEKNLVSQPPGQRMNRAAIEEALKAVRVKATAYRRAFGDANHLEQDILDERKAANFVQDSRNIWVTNTVTDQLLNERDSNARKTNRYRRFSADVLLVADPSKPGGQGFASAGVERVVNQVAKDFGVDAAKFRDRVLQAGAAGSKRSLEQIAKDIQAEDYRASHARRYPGMTTSP